MKQTFEGNLLKISPGGVGVVDVGGKDGLVYFNLRQIKDYAGETVPELARGKWGLRPGRRVRVEANVDDTGEVKVASVAAA